jgi:uncharacterized cupin superfamily protein
MKVGFLRYAPGQKGQPFSRYHWHDTVDVHVVIAGELAAMLDDGSEVVMYPGDFIVVNGVNHAWEARGPDGALVAMFMMGAERVGATPPAHQTAERVLRG